MPWYHNYTVFNIIRVLFMCLNGWIIKRYCKYIPHNFIPVIIVAIATGISVAFFGYFDEMTEWPMQLINGPLCGFAAVGLHQTVEQLRSYYQTKKLMRESKSKKINM